MIGVGRRCRLSHFRCYEDLEGKCMTERDSEHTKSQETHISSFNRSMYIRKKSIDRCRFMKTSLNFSYLPNQANVSMMK